MKALIPLFVVLVAYKSSAFNPPLTPFEEITDILTKVNTYVYGFYKFNEGLQVFQRHLSWMTPESFVEFRDLLRQHYGPHMPKIEREIQGKMYDDWLEKANLENKLKTEYGEMLAYLFGVAGKFLPDHPRKRIYESDLRVLDEMKHVKSLKYMEEYRSRFMEVYGG